MKWIPVKQTPSHTPMCTIPPIDTQQAAARLSIAARSAAPPNTTRPTGPRTGPLRPVGPVGGPGSMGPRRLSGGYGAANGIGGPHGVGGDQRGGVAAGRGNGNGPVPGPAPPSSTTQPETPPLLRKGSADKVTPPGSSGGPPGGPRGRGLPIAVQGGRSNGREGRDPRISGSSGRSLTSGGLRGPRAVSPARSTSSKESLTHAHSMLWLGVCFETNSGVQCVLIILYTHHFLYTHTLAHTPTRTLSPPPHNTQVLVAPQVAVTQCNPPI